MEHMDHLKDLCLRMEDIAATAGLPRYDRVRYDMDAAEVWFLWEDPDDPRAIVVELGSDGDAAAEAFSRGSAVAGDPALN